MEATEFGAYLKELREQAGLSMGQLAKKANVSQPYISQLENGQRGIPSPDVMRKLADSLGVDYFLLNVKAGYLRSDEWINWALNELAESRSNRYITNESVKVDFNEFFEKLKLNYYSEEKVSNQIFTNQSYNNILESLFQNGTRSYDSFFKGGDKTISLEVIMKKVPSLTFQGRFLNSKDRKRILQMLDVLFSDSE